jgi:hypothetical protein
VIHLWRFLALFVPPTRSRVIRTQPDPKVRDNLLVTLEFTPHWIAQKAGDRVFTKTYSGQNTVWHEVATGERANSFREGQLLAVYWVWVRTVGVPRG